MRKGKKNGEKTEEEKLLKALKTNCWKNVGFPICPKIDDSRKPLKKSGRFNGKNKNLIRYSADSSIRSKSADKRRFKRSVETFLPLSGTIPSLIYFLPFPYFPANRKYQIYESYQILIC